MEELELLKKDWRKQERASSFPKLTKDDIYKLLLKKSSSIVKWIFIISLLELAFAIVLGLMVFTDDYKQMTQTIGLNKVMLVIEVLSFAIMFFYIYKFYKNYKAISVTDSSSDLMRNILKTRQTVKNYIKIMLSFSAVVSMITLISSMLYDPRYQKLTEKLAQSMSVTWAYVLQIVFFLFITAVLIGIFWLIYQLLYGLLLRRLKKNYKELKQLEF